MTHLLSVHSYPVVENSTWPISTTDFFLSPPLLNQTEIEETEEKSALKGVISSLEREKQSTEGMAFQIQRSFLEIYEASDQLMDELLVENPSQVQVDRLIGERETLLDKVQGLLHIAQKNMSFDQIMEFIHKLKKDLNSNDQRIKEIFYKSDHQTTKEFLHLVEKNEKLEKGVKQDDSFNDLVCAMSKNPILPTMLALCENQKIRNTYLFNFAVEQLLSGKIRKITEKIDSLKKRRTSERTNPESSKNDLLENDIQNLKIQIQKQKNERAEIQKTAGEIQKFLKESGFLSTGIMSHILSQSRLYKEVNTLIQKRTSFRHSLLTQIEKLIPGEKEEVVQEILRKIKEEEPQARAIFRRKPIEACRDENHRMILYHQLASEITRKSNHTITSINKKIKDLKERLKLLRAHPEPTVSTTKVLSTALISYGLGGVVGLSMVTAIVGYVWLKRKSQASQNLNPQNQEYPLQRLPLRMTQ